MNMIVKLMLGILIEFEFSVSVSYLVSYVFSVVDCLSQYKGAGD